MFVVLHFATQPSRDKEPETMNEEFLAGRQAGREWRKNASAAELQRVRQAAESLGKRGVAEAARRQTGSSSVYAVEFNLGFAVGVLVSESETADERLSPITLAAE